MRFMPCHYLWRFIAVLLVGLPASAQDRGDAAPRLFMRYEHGAAPHRISENILTLVSSISGEARTNIAIRVCSRESMPFAMMTADADPFLLADRLVNAHAYLPARVLFLRSEECLPTDNQPKPVIEVWTIPDGVSLPPHVEAFRSDQISRITLGERPGNRGVRDYRNALRKLIRHLRENPESVGVVFGYFLERPSPVLLGRLREVAKILERSRLPRDRYLVRPEAWNDEASTIPPDQEPSYPSLFIIKVVRSVKKE